MDILCVEDSYFTRNQMIKFLKSLGLSAKGSAGGKEALELVGQGYLPDIILVDLFMPGMDGISLMEKLVQSGIKIPFFLMSTHRPSNFNSLMEQLGGIGIIEKPIIFSKLKKSFFSYCT